MKRQRDASGHRVADLWNSFKDASKYVTLSWPCGRVNLGRLSAGGRITSVPERRNGAKHRCQSL